MNQIQAGPATGFLCSLRTERASAASVPPRRVWWEFPSATLARTRGGRDTGSNGRRQNIEHARAPLSPFERYFFPGVDELVRRLGARPVKALRTCCNEPWAGVRRLRRAHVKDSHPPYKIKKPPGTDCNRAPGGARGRARRWVVTIECQSRNRIEKSESKNSL